MSQAFLEWLMLYTNNVGIFVLKQVVINYIWVCQFTLVSTYFSKYLIAFIFSNLWINQSASSIIDHPQNASILKKKQIC